MPTSPVRNGMNQRAIVQRVNPGVLNPLGQPTPGTLGTIYARMPCRIWEATERRQTADGRYFEETVTKMRAPVAADLKPEDQVTVGTIKRRIETALQRRHHILVTLENFGQREGATAPVLTGAFSEAFGSGFDVVRVVG